MDNIVTVKAEVSDIVARSVTNTFGIMFRRDVATKGAGDGVVEGKGQDIYSSVSLWQDNAINMDFCFVFDRDLLSRIATEAYPADTQDKLLLCQDIACAVANIVVSNVKTYMNGRGYDMSMNIPAPGPVAVNGNEGQHAHVLFRCDSDDGILVNMQMQDRSGPKAG